MKDYIDKSGLKTIGEYINEQDELLSQQLSTKQDALVSGTNIKTINNQSVLGNGNLVVSPSIATAEDIRIAWIMPAKGDIIYIDVYGDNNPVKFRVIKTEGAVATLLSLKDEYALYYEWNVNSKTATFDDGQSYQSFENSTIANKLLTQFVNRTTQAVQDALVPVTLTQTCYRTTYPKTPEEIAAVDFSGVDLTNVRMGFTKVAQRTITSTTYKAFALGLEDIQEYLGLQPGDTVTSKQLMLMFSGVSYDRSSSSIWLGSASTDTDYVYTIQRDRYQRICTEHRGFSSQTIRPAFKINLTSIPYTKG